MEITAVNKEQIELLNKKIGENTLPPIAVETPDPTPNGPEVKSLLKGLKGKRIEFDNDDKGLHTYNSPAITPASSEHKAVSPLRLAITGEPKILTVV